MSQVQVNGDHRVPFPRRASLSLRARLMLLVMVLIVPWVVGMTYHFWDEQQRAIRAGTEDAMDLARALAARQEQAMAGARDMLHVLTTLPEVRSGAPDVCHQRLAEINRQAEDYANLLVTDAQGHMICVAKGTKQIEFGDRTWFQQAVTQRDFIATPMVVGRMRGLPILPTAQPVLNASGQIDRVVMAAVSVEWLARLLRQQARLNGGEVSVVDGAGVIVAQEPANAAMLGGHFPLQAVRDAILTKGQPEASGEDKDDRGRPMLYALSKVPSVGAGMVPVYVVVTMPKESVSAPADREFHSNVGVLGVFTTGMLALIWFLIERFALRDVRTLTDLARRVAKGDFQARAALSTARGEVGELADAFDNMAASIEQYFQQATRIMEVVPEAIIMSNAEGRIVRANVQAEEVFGYTTDELIGQSIEMLIPDRLRGTHAGHRQRYLRAPIPRRIGARNELMARRKDGTEFPADISLGTLKTEQGALVISAVRDISERKEYEARITHQATHDDLTGLPNRVLFRELLEHAMVQAERTEKLLAVVFLDLDDFKKINDTLGHDAGDALLKTVSQRVVAVLRKDDVVARQGGDEFTLLLSGLHVFQDIVHIADKLIASISQPVQYQGHVIHTSASLGVTVFPFDDHDVESLLRNADTAMYEAKQAGKNNFRFYTADMNVAMCERMEIEQGLRQALERNEFELHFQPQVAIDGLHVIGVEALLRWTHPERGPISPSKFIPVAEETNLIMPIGEWVLREACRHIRRWRESGWRDLTISVNLSARQFRQDTLLDTVQRILRETGLDPESGALALELTESMVMQRVDAHVRTLNRLHAMGVGISIDDFGTGYSSLSYLKRFPIQTLKIDQSFVRDLTVDPEDAAIAATIVTLGHSLKMQVIAEGVETAEQLDILRGLGCDAVQGYHLSRPLPAAALDAFLASRRTV